MLTRKNSIIKTLVLVVAIMCFLASMVSSGYASPVTKVEELRVQVSISNNHPIIIIGAYLFEDTSLPAQVSIAVPEGAQIVWVGEIAGTDPGADPTTTYELLETKDGWDIYLVDATKHHIVQIEAQLTSAYLTSLAPNYGSADFLYVPVTDVALLTVAAETPSNVVNYDQKSGYEVYGSGPNRGMLYGPSYIDAEANEVYGVSYNYETIEETADGSGSGTDSFSTVLIVLVIVLLAAVAALFFIISRQRTGTTQTEKLHSGSSASRSKTQQNQGPISKSGAKAAAKTGGFKLNSPQVLIIGLIVIAGVALLIWASSRNANTITENSGVYAQSFAAGDPCESVEFELTDAAMQNPKKAAEEIFKAIRSSGVHALAASLDSNTGIVSVEFCGSSANPDEIARAVESSGLVSGSIGKSLNTPISLDGGVLVIYFDQHPPCVTNAFTIENPEADTVAFIQKLADAVRGVPTISGVAYDPATATASFGFCEDAGNDEAIATALEKAGIEATLKAEMADATPNSVLY